MSGRSKCDLDVQLLVIVETLTLSPTCTASIVELNKAAKVRALRRMFMVTLSSVKKVKVYKRSEFFLLGYGTLSTCVDRTLDRT